MEVATGISIRNYKNMLRIPVSLNYTELRYIVHRIKIKGSADGRSWEKHLPFILLTLPTSNLLFVFVHCSVCTMGGIDIKIPPWSKCKDSLFSIRNMLVHIGNSNSWCFLKKGSIATPHINTLGISLYTPQEK